MILNKIANDLYKTMLQMKIIKSLNDTNIDNYLIESNMVISIM